MDQFKFGQFIKEIRKQNNLTQKQFADKYNITSQAVSKWENGKNMPDMALIKQISEDFNISLEDMFAAELSSKKKKKYSKIIWGLLTLIIILILCIFINLLINNKSDFNFKTLSSNCDNFQISGNIAYNDKKSSIYITNIKYCGNDDFHEYKEIECILYETNKDIDKKISSYRYQDENYITLEDFLQTVTFSVDNYQKICHDYSKNSLILAINAKDKNDLIISYKIPLTLENACN